MIILYKISPRFTISFFLTNLLQEEQHYFTMAFSLDHVKALPETDSVMELKSIQSMIVGKFKRPPLHFRLSILC